MQTTNAIERRLLPREMYLGHLEARESKGKEMHVKLLMKGSVCSACLYELEEQWLSMQSDTVGEPS